MADLVRSGQSNRNLVQPLLWEVHPMPFCPESVPVFPSLTIIISAVTDFLRCTRFWVVALNINLGPPIVLGPLNSILGCLIQSFQSRTQRRPYCSVFSESITVLGVCVAFCELDETLLMWHT
ncbi:hypothetical protein OUZ56_028392 [Daphnia magna]|uniref:Uncharacterized protein n=1 Tax=Daphnia magna TaxID=35525 RepID=A0ABR0B4A9_9CRUS|nr:hypothetical protein OUZ56_028392 [Daphnia magna]